MYAITGITGRVGGSVARALLSAGHQVRAVVRDSAKGAAWAERRCEVAQAGMDDAAALSAAFAGAEGVFVLIPPIFDPLPDNPEVLGYLRALRAALETARPGRMVCLSTVGAQVNRPNLLRWLGVMEQEFGTLPMPVAFLRAAWFMENASWDVASARDTGVIHSFLQPLDKPIPMVATADIGRVAAERLAGTWTGAEVVELEGPRRYSPNDIAAAFAGILGRPVRAEAVAREKWRGLFAAQGMHNPEPRLQMLDGFNEGWINFQGQPETTTKGRVDLDVVLRKLIEEQKSTAP